MMRLIPLSYRYLIAFLFVLSIVIVFSLGQIKKTSEQYIELEMATLHQSLKQNLLDNFKQLSGIIQSISNREDIHKNIVALIDQQASGSINVASDSYRMLQEILASESISHHFGNFYIIDQYSTILVSSDKTATDQLLPGPTHITHALLQPGTRLSQPFLSAEHKLMRYISSPINIPHTQHPVWLILSEVDSTLFAIKLIHLHESMDAFLVNDQGVLLTYKSEGKQALLDQEELPNRLNQQTALFADNTQDDIDPRFEYWQWVPELNSYLVIEKNKASALENYYYIRSLLIKVILILLAIGLFTSYIYIKRKQRDELKRRKSRESLLDSLAEGVMEMSPEGIVEFANTKAMEILGFSSIDEIRSQPMHTLIHHSYPDHSPMPEDECQLLKARMNHQTSEGREVFWHQNGQPIHITYQMQPVLNSSPQRWVISFLDITDKIKAEQEQTLFRQKIEHTQRLESLGILAGGIAHDFNNILAAIMGNSTLAEYKLAELNAPAHQNQELLDYLQNINASSEQAALLCRQMLAYAGKGKVSIKPIDLSDNIRNMLKLMQVSLGKHIELKCELADKLPIIRTDPAQFQQLIMNLITNANEAIGDQAGVITCRTGIVEVDIPYLQLCYAENASPGTYCYVEIRDSGCGIERADQEKIFEPFYTTKFTGRGLGLSAVLGIMNSQQGALSLYSEINTGTVFRLLFPVQNTDIDASATTTEDFTNSLRKSSGLVLIVDDEDDVRDIAVTMLQSIGFKTLTARNGKEALKIFEQRHESLTMVLMDISMPEIDGPMAFERMHQLNPKVPVVLSSGYNEQEAAPALRDKGLAGFLQKPYSFGTIQQYLKQILEQ